MNLRKIKIVKAYSLNRLVAKDEFENLIEIFVYSGFSWNVIQEFQEFNYRNLVGRIDDLGRIVIPKEIRKVLRIKEGDPLLKTLEHLRILNESLEILALQY